MVLVSLKSNACDTLSRTVKAQWTSCVDKAVVSSNLFKVKGLKCSCCVPRTKLPEICITVTTDSSGHTAAGEATITCGSESSWSKLTASLRSLGWFLCWTSPRLPARGAPRSVRHKSRRRSRRERCPRPGVLWGWIPLLPHPGRSPGASWTLGARCPHPEIPSPVESPHVAAAAPDPAIPRPQAAAQRR